MSWTYGKIFIGLIVVGGIVGACAPTPPRPVIDNSVDAQINAVSIACGQNDMSVSLEQWEDCAITTWCAPGATGTQIAGSPEQCVDNMLAAFGYTTGTSA